MPLIFQLLNCRIGYSRNLHLYMVCRLQKWLMGFCQSCRDLHPFLFWVPHLSLSSTLVLLTISTSRNTPESRTLPRQASVRHETYALVQTLWCTLCVYILIISCRDENSGFNQCIRMFHSKLGWYLVFSTDFSAFPQPTEPLTCPISIPNVTNQQLDKTFFLCQIKAPAVITGVFTRVAHSHTQWTQYRDSPFSKWLILALFLLQSKSRLSVGCYLSFN